MNKIFCRHDWKIMKDTIHLVNNGSSKRAKFYCEKCCKVKEFDIFDKKPNKYVFNEQSKSAISDGSHTFDELYFHRMVLFSILCNTYEDNAWKSWYHNDGTMYVDCFIVGINTPLGEYTYHYPSKYWDLFRVEKLDRAPEWDGHKPNDIYRLYSLLPGYWKSYLDLTKDKKFSKFGDWNVD